MEAELNLLRKIPGASLEIIVATKAMEDRTCRGEDEGSSSQVSIGLALGSRETKRLSSKEKSSRRTMIWRRLNRQRRMQPSEKPKPLRTNASNIKLCVNATSRSSNVAETSHSQTWEELYWKVASVPQSQSSWARPQHSRKAPKHER